ncbi:UbiA prenyltransferase family protein [Flavobacteriaceae bacterium S0825]|uniref:UbiA family prenyltransferase n=1 Tax=Gaetbulibacter sp. S0825 TaxID=2720084 RepID=UPI001430CBB0|nr:UbiA prenyltransferase family protein [Flavobacteriaceae bacterium S0825]NIX65920.1 UbiA prenyltransferase family protein [Gaetbulibacter sp. S0825]
MQHWIKNTFVFLPMFFNKQFYYFDTILLGLLAFISFSLISSAVYCFNDIVDVDFDKNHIDKKNRPLAKGTITKAFAKRIAISFFLFGIILGSFLINKEFVFVLVLYFILNIGYTFGLKKIIVLDILMISFGFVLRVLAGGVATETPLTYWILIMVFLLAIFLTLGKRRDEVLFFNDTNILVRENIEYYNIKIIDKFLYGIATLLIILYIIYSFSKNAINNYGSDYIFITAIFVIAGMIRYFNLILRRLNSANPTKILWSDNVMQLIVLGWILCFCFFIYF